MEKKFERHFVEISPLIKKLIHSKRDSFVVLALLVVESYFRPYGLRLLEYIYWTFMLFIRRKSVDNISLGLAQIKYKYWRMIGFPKSNWVRDLKTMESPYYNYDCCKAYLLKHCKNYEKLDYSNILKIYNGDYSKYYLKLFSKTMWLLKKNVYTNEI